jgi:hypothetical protein
MRTLTRRMNKKGVSPIIGVVLLSAVMFSIIALLLVWAASQEELKVQRERERIQQLKLVEGESFVFLDIPDGNLITQDITIYNNGTARPNIEHVYVNNTEISFSVSWDGANPRKGYITINDNTAADTDSVKVETQLGNLYPYLMPSAVIEILSISDFQDEVRVLIDGSKSNAVGAVINKWDWTVTDTDGTTQYDGSRVDVRLAKGDSTFNCTIALTVYDNTDSADGRPGYTELTLAIPAVGSSGEGGEGYPGFGGEGAPGGIYISLGGTGGGTSVSEGRIIAFNIKNFSGRMIPLTSLRFYGIKNPSNYTCDTIYVAPAGKVLDAGDLYYSGATINDGGLASFDKPYYMGDKDEVHVELTASGGAKPKEGEVYMIILYDAATPQSYYTITVPIRELDETDDIEFAAGNFQVTGGGFVLQGKSLDLDKDNDSTSSTLMSIGVAFSSPDDDTDPCEDRLLTFKVAGTAEWTGSVASESNIYFGTDTDADGVPDTGTTWTNSRTVQWEFNFNDVAKRFYYFVYRFVDGSSVAHKIPRFTVELATGEPERQDTTASAGGTYSWDVDVNQKDVLETPVEFTVAGLPCFCTATFTPASKVDMPNTVTLSIEVLPGAPTGLYPIVVTATNNLNAYSCVIFLYIENV